MKKNVCPLYPDVSDTPLKRVSILVDSVPGRANTEILAQLRLKGFYLIPCVLNTTHVTQATDRNYGQFKSVYRENLKTLTGHQFNLNKTIQPTDIPQLIFWS